MQVGFVGIGILQAGKYHIGIAVDSRKQVIEVMCHAAGQAPDGFELLGLPATFPRYRVSAASASSQPAGCRARWPGRRFRLSHWVSAKDTSIWMGFPSGPACSNSRLEPASSCERERLPDHAAGSVSAPFTQKPCECGIGEADASCGIHHGNSLLGSFPIDVAEAFARAGLHGSRVPNMLELFVHDLEIEGVGAKGPRSAAALLPPLIRNNSTTNTATLAFRISGTTGA